MFILFKKQKSFFFYFIFIFNLIKERYLHYLCNYIIYKKNNKPKKIRTPTDSLSRNYSNR